MIGRVEGRPSPEAAHRFAALDNLGRLRAADVPLYSPAHPRWAFVLQPVCIAHLNPIEPWWRVPRSLALNGRRFEAWVEVSAAAARTACWNAHRHPFASGVTDDVTVRSVRPASPAPLTFA